MRKINSSIIFLIILSLIFLQYAHLEAELKKAPNFKLRDPWDFEFSLYQFEGKPVILHFFRIYCGGRITRESFNEIKELNKVCAELCKGEKCTEGDLHMISIALATCPTTDLKEWAEYFNINWLLGNDYDDYELDIIKNYSGYLSKLKDPALIFVSKNQEIVFTSNYLDASKIIEKLEEISQTNQSKTSENGNIESR
jgi:peroxiredoxin